MKKYNLVLSILSIVGFTVAMFLVCKPDAQDICRGAYREFAPYMQAISLYTLIISLVSYFVREEVFRAWGKFALWFIPLSALLVSYAPDYSHDWIFPLDKKFTGSSLAILFFSISLLIIAVKSWRLRRK